MLATDAGEPLQKIVDAGTTFEVLEERSNRHSCSREYPGATDAIGHAFNSRALLPIQHGASLDLFDTAGNRPRSRWLARHLIPGAPFELATGSALEHSAPLLEEERDARVATLIPNVENP